MALSAGLVAGKPQRGTIKFMHPNAGGQIKHLCPMRLNRHCVHTVAVKPHWAQVFDLTASIGVHKFYRAPLRLASN